MASDNSVTNATQSFDLATTPIGYTQSDLENIPERVVPANMWMFKLTLQMIGYSGLGTMCVGILGNILIIMTCVISQQVKESSSYTYLVNLAASDLVYCTVQLTRNIGLVAFQKDIVMQFRIWCKLWHYMTHVCRCISGWTMAAVTVERVMIIFNPLEAKVRCTPGKARVAAIVIDIAGLVLSSYMLFVYGIDTDQKSCISAHRDELTTFFTKSFRPNFELVMIWMGPWLILIVSNALIVAKMVHYRKSSSEIMGNQDQEKAIMATIRPMTILLITASLAYLVFTGPLNITLFVWKSDPFSEPLVTEKAVMRTFYLGLWVILNSLNYAVNFIIYCLSGRMFRMLVKKTFLILLGKSKPKKIASTKASNKI